MKRTEDLEMESGDSGQDFTYTNMSDLHVQRMRSAPRDKGDSGQDFTYTNMSDLHVQKMRSAPRDKAAKNTRCRVILILGVLLILGFLILVSLVSLLFTYHSDLMSKVTEIESSVKNISTDKDTASLSSDIQRILGVLGRVTEEVRKLNSSAGPICSTGWTHYGLSCYYLSSDSKPWTAARKDCEDRKAHLVVINGEGEMDFLRGISKGNSVWIGLSEEDGTWRWVDGTSYDKTPKFWGVNQPDDWKGHDFGGGEDCVVIRNGDKWNDVHCSLSVQYICEKKIF